MTPTEDFIKAAHDGQVEDKTFLAGKLVEAHAEIDQLRKQIARFVEMVNDISDEVATTICLERWNRDQTFEYLMDKINKIDAIATYDDADIAAASIQAAAASATDASADLPLAPLDSK